MAEVAAQGLVEQIQETVEAIASKVPLKPGIGIILGTGLTQLLDHVDQTEALAYADLPHMPHSTAPGHRGRLVFGHMGRLRAPVVIMDGRFHLYEGYHPKEVVYPVRVMKALGIQTLLISNVAGGLNPAFAIGDLMLVTDHINLLGMSPLVGPNDERVGVRFPDMIQPYDLKLVELAEQIAHRERIPSHRGVYVAMLGPQLETKAEYRWLRSLGADAVGMSTVPEVIAAVHAGLRVFAVSIVSDLCIPETLKPVNIEHIIAVANRTQPLLTKLMLGIIDGL